MVVPTVDAIDFGKDEGSGDWQPLEETHIDMVQESVDAIPSACSPEWNEYVLSKLLVEEKFNGNPTVDGLRRVTEMVLGEIVYIETDIKQYPTPENQHRATVIVRVGIRDGNTREIKHFDGAADAFLGNIDGEIFQKHPTSIAETRAEGRAYKKALKLRKVVTAEELSTDATRISTNLVERINDNQITFTDIMCKKLNVDVNKVVQTLYPSHIITVLSYEQAQAVQKLLTEYQTQSIPIPENVKGYNPNWRTV